jgi:hypothetical protein
MNAIIFLTGTLTFIPLGLVYPLIPLFSGKIIYLDFLEVNSFMLRALVRDYDP